MSETKYDIGRRLAEVRHALGLSRKRFGEILGVSERTIIRYEKGEYTPPPKFIKRLEKILKVNPKWLLYGRGEMFLSNEEIQQVEQLKEEILEKSKTLRPIDIKYVPVVGYVSAGPPESQEENILGWVPVEVNTPADYGLIVDGDSMEPLILEGSVVIIQRVSPWQLKNGDIVVARINDAYALKEFYMDSKSKKVILRSRNKKYDDIVIDPEQIPLYIVGKAVKLVLDL